MMCAVSLPVTLSLYRSLPTLSIIHVYYSCRISRHAHNGLALWTARISACAEMYRAPR